MPTFTCAACGLPLAAQQGSCPFCGSLDRNTSSSDTILVFDTNVLVDVIDAVREPEATTEEYRGLVELLQRAADDKLSVEQAAERVSTTRFERLEQWLQNHSGSMGALGIALAAAALALAVANFLKPAPPPTEVHVVNHIEIHIELSDHPSEDEILNRMRTELRRLLHEGQADP